MKAMLRNDWYVQRRYIIALFVIFGTLTALVFSAFKEPQNIDETGLRVVMFILLLPMNVFMGLTSAKAISDSNRSGWLRLMSALPVRRELIIIEKALFGLLAMAAHSLFVTVFLLIVIPQNSIMLTAQIIMNAWTVQLILSGSLFLFTVLAGMNLYAAIMIVVGTAIAIPNALAFIGYLISDHFPQSIIPLIMLILRSLEGSILIFEGAVLIYVVSIFFAVFSYCRKSGFK